MFIVCRAFAMGVLTASAICGASLAQQGVEPFGPSNPKGTEAKIRQFISDLDADVYEARMAATRHLIQLGDQVVPLLTQALRTDPSPELQSRGVEILQRLASHRLQQQPSSGRGALDGGAAERALVELTELSHANRADSPKVAAISARASQKIAAIRKLQRATATEWLRNLGARITDERVTEPQRSGIFLTATFAAGWLGRPEDLELLKYLDTLEAVVLDGSQFSPEYLHHLHAVPQLTHLSIKRARIEDDSIPLLLKMPSLQSLYLYYVPISDRSVPVLAELPIQSMHLYGTRITSQGKEDLSAALQNASVDYRHGAFLGIGGPEIAIPGNLGCDVNKVAPNSAAARAGIQLGDVVTAYNGKAVRSFEEIKNLIAENQAGENVEIELIRGHETIRLTVTLGEWD